MAKGITYKDAGVNVEKANRLVGSIRLLNRKSPRRGSIGSIGGFSGLFDGRFRGMKEPVLAASTDGVGTKLIVANIAGKHDTVGIDLVAMCVNDLVACGAEPLFFLDYYGTGRLNAARMLDVIKGIIKGCRTAGCNLIGGETAELPGLYKDEDYDIAGFAVGVVDKKDVIDGARIKKGDVILGIPSSGPHSNGYSLIRKVFSKNDIRGNFKEALLRPTVIYVKPVLGLLKKVEVHGISHITGGGFYDNISRILPKDRAAVLNRHAWKVPAVFSEIQRRAGLDDKNMYRTFNMGIGMTLILNRGDAGRAQGILSKYGMRPVIIGEIVKGDREVVI